MDWDSQSVSVANPLKNQAMLAGEEEAYILDQAHVPEQ